MPDSRLNGAERIVQRTFMKSRLFNGLLVACAIVAGQGRIADLPDRRARPPARVELRYTAVALPPARGPLRLAGAWALTAADPRLSGLSGLAIDRGGFVAISDSGVVIRLPRPGRTARMAHVQDLPAGPGDPRYKSRRDSEALARLSDGDWLVAFENRDALWRYDRYFRSGRPALTFEREGWKRNRGIEAMAIDRDDRLLLIPEARRTLIVVSDVVEYYPLADGGWTVGDVARLPDGRMFVLLRRVTVTGLRNAIGELTATRAGWRIRPVAALPIGGLDNAEGLAAELLGGGGTRLWVVTDNDGARYRRTLLLALDLPAAPTQTPGESRRAPASPLQGHR